MLNEFARKTELLVRSSLLSAVDPCLIGSFFETNDLDRKEKQ